MGILLISAIVSLVVYCVTFGDLVAKVGDRAREIAFKGGYDACLDRARKSRDRSGQKQVLVVSEEGLLL